MVVKVKRAKGGISKKAHHLLFQNIHGRRLIYNTCWEDPRIDRQLLNLNQDSKVIMITSAGCNALDYALDHPAEIHSVDVNYRQNALLHLKLSLIQHSNYNDLFAMFGIGGHIYYREVYRNIRESLPDYAQDFWDHKISYFKYAKLKGSFYYHGTSGDVAWLLTRFLNRNRKIKSYIYAMLEANSLEEQKAIYAEAEPALWTKFINWIVKHPILLAMVGVPRPQIQLIAQEHEEGIVGYVRANLKHVLTEVLMRENYFWRVYITGSYTPTCCPNYLKLENFETLRANTPNIVTHTTTLTNFMQNHSDIYTHFILLDHQDWLAWHNPDALIEEWEMILANSRSGSKIIMRSASPYINFLPPSVSDALCFFPEKTWPLHQQDRVGTYGSLHLAEVK